MSIRDDTLKSSRAPKLHVERGQLRNMNRAANKFCAVPSEHNLNVLVGYVDGIVECGISEEETSRFESLVARLEAEATSHPDTIDTDALQAEAAVANPDE